ncbi:MAG: hypothetical protein J7599_19405 [Niabella sp.]|nr:hypothetical protein [Niabella sp.]
MILETTFKRASVFSVCAFAVIGLVITACNRNDNVKNESKIALKSYSQTPALIKKLEGFENLEVYSLISSEDKLPESPDYVFGGTADGSGTIKNPNGDGFIMMVNNEDNYALSKITLDRNFKPVKGAYALNSDAGQWRLCSGTMATKEEHGFGPYYLCVGESSAEAQTHKIDPLATGIQSSTATAGLGHWSGENAVPLNRNAYPGKTVIIMGEDDDTETGGQVVLYQSNTVGDLDNGSQYMLRRTDGEQNEITMKPGSVYDVEFVKIENHKTLTGAQIQALVNPLKAIKFGRVEDLDYRKGDAAKAREIYFNVTGQDYKDANADRSRTKYGRVYRLVLDAANPLKGKLECILDGDDKSGPAKLFQNPDNICVTSNYVYIQEDANTYGDETHDAYIYQYNIATKELKKVFELDHRRGDANFMATATKGNWEYGALVDLSDIIGIPNTFSLCIQPHTWKKSPAFQNPDKGTKRPNENQGSQIVLIKGLPR